MGLKTWRRVLVLNTAQTATPHDISGMGECVIAVGLIENPLHSGMISDMSSRMIRVGAGSLLALLAIGYLAVGAPLRYALRILLVIVICAAIGWMSAEAQAEEQHRHGAHVHGIAHLNVALEGKILYMEFVSPAANIVGFEHHPKNQAERDAVESARNTLKNAEAVFKLPPAAGARLVDASVASEAEHDAHHDAEHAHDGEKHHENEAGGDHEHHDADAHESETHSDFRAVYRFSCQKPDKLAAIEVLLFKLFPGIEEIEVQILTETKQTALELTAQKPKFRL